ncbi:50S ribosomal protein L11 [archaeon]|nr:50S ribosomal protein L11 [archaeon]MBT3731217.1 50S ribosomal protein L11 [archaeon]MBT4670029.1 50S ribosomal protein L11 [archaeon]MBT5287769.1 50S ribosomal protein L11 [archaeon]MBT7052774.1 50S ribosomal protein L11 [archaeon]
MAKETIDALVEGGKASAAPPLGPALGPLKVNIGQVVAEINKKTAAFNGMKVPVKVIVDTETKEFEITVGTPPVSGLIKKELGIKSGSGIPNKDKVANMAMEDVIKIANMKRDAFFAKTVKAASKIVIGSCNAMGILVEGKIAVEINVDVDAGKYDEVFKAEKTDVSDDKRKVLEEQLATFNKQFAGELAKMQAAKKAKEEKEAKKEAKVAK